MPLAARLIILAAGVGLFFLVFELVRTRRFREELSIVWLFLAVAVAAGSVIDIIIDPLAKALRITYPPAFAFTLIIILLIIALFYFSLVISDLKSKIKELSQKIALMDFEIRAGRGEKEE